MRINCMQQKFINNITVASESSQKCNVYQHAAEFENKKCALQEIKYTEIN